MTPLAQETCRRLLRAIDDSPGFAGLATSLTLVSQLAVAEAGGDLREFNASILRDAALTAQLLRLANAGSQHRARGGRNVTTMDQALAILGLDRVKTVLLSVRLLESLGQGAQAERLHAEIVAALYCGQLCGELAHLRGGRVQVQEAQVAGLLQNLGRMMVTYHLWPLVEQSHALQVAQNLSEEDALLATLGCSHASLAAEIARHWQLPIRLQQAVALEYAEHLPLSSNPQEWLAQAALLARCLTDALFRQAENREVLMVAQLCTQFREALQLRKADIGAALEHSLKECEQLLEALAFPCQLTEARLRLRRMGERVHERLSAHDSLTRPSKQLAGRVPLEICQQVLRQFHDHYGFSHSLLLLPDGSSGLVTIAGVGRNAATMLARLRCQGVRPDLLRLVCERGMDLYIADTRAAPYAQHLPEWVVNLIGARSLLLLPLMHQGQALGLLYGDHEQPRVEAPADLGAAGLRLWRAQLLQALMP